MSQIIKSNKVFTRTDLVDYAKHTLTFMWSQFKDGNFCDVVLISGQDGKQIKAHRLVLCAATEYFFTMFSSSFKEAIEKEVTIANISIDVLQLLVEYCYTGSVELNEANAQLLLSQASLMLFPELEKACIDYLLPLLSPSNCLSIYEFAKHHHFESLLKGAEEYKRKHFINVVVTNQFFELNVDQVQEYLSDNEINVDSEQDVFKAMMRWIEFDFDNRKAELTKLLSTIRLHYIDNTFLLEYIIKNVRKECIFSLIDGIKENLFMTKAVYERTNLKPNSIVFVCKNKIQIYDILSETIKNNYENTGEDFIPNIVDEKLIFVGKTVKYLDLNNGIWHDLPSMKSSKSTFSVAMLKGFLYAVGETTVERFDYNINKWNYIANMEQNRNYHTTVTLNGKLYAIGGYYNEYLNSVECYDPIANNWSFCGPMVKKRANAKAIAFKGKIFVFGGKESSSAILNCIERYNPETNTWSWISEMSCKRYDMAACILNDKILLYGGHDGTQYLTSMEEYDPLTNKSKIITAFPFEIAEKIPHMIPFYKSTNFDVID